tara:strand:+ start:261 stop:560 length:300 start_codon:yes stop_codon:yes gene_type:complete
MKNINLNKAFADLRKVGYFAKQNFLCCQSCGWAAIPEENKDKAVFYHAQDNDDKKEGKDFYIVWSGNGAEICQIFNRNGVNTNWNGSIDTRIMIINSKE